MGSKAARQYIAHIRRHLVCSAGSRKQLLRKGKELVARFGEENPDAQYSDFVSAFGPPENFAGEMLSSVDGKEVANAQRRHRCVKRTALVGLVLILIVAAVFWFAKWSKAQKVVNGDFRIESDSFQSMTEGEFDAVFEFVEGEK